VGDRYEGLEDFLAARGRALLRSAYLLTGDRGHAEDVLQEALLRVAPRWRRLVASGSPEAYLRQTMYRLVVDGWRSRSRRPSEVLGDVTHAAQSPGPTDFAGDVSRRVTLDQALRRLTARQRQVLVLRFYQDLTEVQTAAVMGCSVSTVKSQTHHSLRRLRELAPELAEFFDEAAAEEVRA
jgi:RNA polymerase sigma-70 factor (sigma-E family)